MVTKNILMKMKVVKTTSICVIGNDYPAVLSELEKKLILILTTVQFIQFLKKYYRYLILLH